MRIPVSEAKGQLTELVRRAEAGEDVVLTRHGQAAVKLVAIRAAGPTAEEKADLLERIWKSAAKNKNARRGPRAARSQDFLYDKSGLPK
jgi:prevent-host-death family protein